MSDAAITVTGVAVGGEGVGRLVDGRVVFVAGTVPGDEVEIELTEIKKRHARARVTAVVRPSPQRADPPCPEVGRGCGGCDWQHVDPDARVRLLTGMVDDALRRQGGEPAASCRYGGSVPTTGYRTTLRLAVVAGRAGHRRARSHDVVHVDACLVAAEPLHELIGVHWRGVEEVTLRCGLRTGERMAVVRPASADAAAPRDDGEPDGVTVPDDVRVVSASELAGGKRAWFHEEAGGRRWRVSAESFFQSGPDAAELLIATVDGLVGGDLDTAASATDLYGGVGLFTGALGALRPRTSWTHVESSPSAVADARVNLADIDVRIVRSNVERWSATPAGVVIADPPRSGLRRDGVGTVAATGADVVCLVSCDVGSLGRDVGLMRSAGYDWTSSVLLDLFPQTSHVEVVTRFDRS